MRDQFGNPSSLYPIGRQGKESLNEARGHVARSLGAAMGDIYFTGSGTESDNQAILGVLDALPDRPEIVISAIEHPGIQETAAYCERRGVRVTTIPVDAFGELDLGALARRRDAADGAGLDHARQQRDRDDPADRPDRRNRPRKRGPPPHRRRPVLRQDRRRRERAGGGPPDRLRPQDLRTQGRGRALRPARHAAGSVRPRRPPGARLAGRDREHHRHRRLRRSGAHPARAHERRTSPGSPPSRRGCGPAWNRASRRSSSTATRRTGCRPP